MRTSIKHPRALKLRWWHWSYISARKRRLCARSGHRWGVWLSYMSGEAVTHYELVEGEGLCHTGSEVNTEHGEERSCRRCHERQFRRVSFNGSDEV